jgi:hypothetical protein
LDFAKRLLPVAAKILSFFQKGDKRPQHENHGTCAQSEDQFHFDRPGHNGQEDAAAIIGRPWA